MPKAYRVQQGDHLSKIAAKFGFLDYAPIWNHPQNAHLKQLRQNPNVLLPGDTLLIPDKQHKEEARGADQSHHFQIKLPTLKLRLKLETRYKGALANRKYHLQWEGAKPHPERTNGEGKLEEIIPNTTEFVTLQMQPYEETPTIVELSVRVGHLDPVTEVSGWQARLNNLGYHAGDDPLPESFPGQKAEEVLAQLPWPQQERLRSAIEEFQCDNHLPVDGKCGPTTQAKLKAVHGC